MLLSRVGLRSLIVAGFGALATMAQDITPTTGVDLPVIGRLATRAASEIASSPWSIGGETLDRDFAVYEHYKRYLGPLGAKAIRLQAGWAKCERQPGVYDFAWLDAIVDVALPRGRFVAPVLVDLRTGLVCEIGAGRWKQTAVGAEFRALPLYDSPMLIAERAALRLQSPLSR